MDKWIESLQEHFNKGSLRRMVLDLKEEVRGAYTQGLENEIEKLTDQNKRLIEALERLSKTGDGSHGDKHASFYDCLPTLQIEFSERIDYARAVLKEVGANP